MTNRTILRVVFIFLIVSIIFFIVIPTSRADLGAWTPKRQFACVLLEHKQTWNIGTPMEYGYQMSKVRW